MKLRESVKNARFCVSKMKLRTNGVGIENSDPATSCGSIFFDVAGISWTFSQKFFS